MFERIKDLISIRLVNSHTPESSAPEKVQNKRSSNPIKPKMLASELKGYNHSLVSYMLDRFTFDFKLSCIGEPSLSIHINHISVFDHKPVVKAKSTKEIN